jgi:type IV secretion system protein VirB2
MTGLSLKNTYAEKAIYAGLFILMMASPSLAQLAPVQTTLQQIITIFTGPIGTSLAVLAVVTCGVMAWMGRLTVFAAISAVIGIVLVFGAANIVEFFKASAGGQ